MSETTTGPTVVAAFKHRAQAHRAVDALLEAGFMTERIRVDDHRGPHGHLTHDEAGATAPAWPARFVAAGAGLGSALGTGVGWLRGQTRRGRLLGPTLVGLGLGAAGGYALAAFMRPPAPRPSQPVGWDEGGLERGHAVVEVEAGRRIADAESILRTFAGRGVHVLRDAEPVQPVVVA